MPYPQSTIAAFDFFGSYPEIRHSAKKIFSFGRCSSTSVADNLEEFFIVMSSATTRQLSSRSGIHGFLWLAGLLIFLLLLSMLAYINTGSLAMMLHVGDMLREGWMIFAGTMVSVYFLYYATSYMQQWYRRRQKQFVHYLTELLVVVTGGFIIQGFFHVLFVRFIVVPEADRQALDTKLHHLLLMSQLMIIIGYGAITAFGALRQLNRQREEVAQLEQQLLQQQFESLKNQLNPHFLFNSLSVLSSLVPVNADAAEKFIENLSRTYRYLLDQREKTAVPLKEEWQFLQYYEGLLQQRYGQRLALHAAPAPASHKLFLLPHTLLIVMEYILGSEAMSEQVPLVLELSYTEDHLLIRYSHRPKTGIQPAMANRWQQLQQQYKSVGLSVMMHQDVFSKQKSIHIPLLKHD